MLTPGVYLDYNNRSAVVVRVQDSKVVYLTMNVTRPDPKHGRAVFETIAQKVSLVSVNDTDFAHQFCTFLPDYPVMRALRIYYRSGLDVTPEAEKVIKLIAAKHSVRQKGSRP